MQTPVEEPDDQGSFLSVALGVGAGLLGWALAFGMSALYVPVALEYDQSRVRCGETPVLMYALGLLMLVAILAVSAGVTYAGTKIWRLDLRVALSRSGFLLAPLAVAWLLGIVWFNALVIRDSVCGT